MANVSETLAVVMHATEDRQRTGSLLKVSWWEKLIAGGSPLRFALALFEGVHRSMYLPRIL
jgi:hypothetical protein